MPEDTEAKTSPTVKAVGTVLSSRTSSRSLTRRDLFVCRVRTGLWEPRNQFAKNMVQLLLLGRLRDMIKTPWARRLFVWGIRGPVSSQLGSWAHRPLFVSSFDRLIPPTREERLHRGQPFTYSWPDYGIANPACKRPTYRCQVKSLISLIFLNPPKLCRLREIFPETFPLNGERMR